MADETTADGSGDNRNAVQDQGINIHTQYIKDLSVENPNSPAIFMEMEEGPEVTVNLDVEAERLQDRVYEVAINANIGAKVNDKTAFQVELKYAGLISLDDQVDDQKRDNLVLIETPRYLFPFARDIISKASRDAGYPPLLINPVDFAKLYEQQKARQTASQEQQ
ncbi:protein translocase subunit secB [Limimonas halophila]|uniref:Protein-export protein SecB n=1 Tax=Limimonas halophila TaxID=1082479 RepID=A0A1G7SLS4_9PROT|nr:protein-export chaperone SecB [Limimonas halophila]SDG24037.1 protein translocase subunit secB [Limimonas halophila]